MKPKKLTLKAYWEANSSAERTEIIEKAFIYIELLENKLIHYELQKN